MNVYQTEEQQIELIKSLWKKYGSTLITTCCIFLILFYGYKIWNQSVWNNTYSASAQFETLMTEFSAGKKSESQAKTTAELIIKEFSSTPYSSMSALVLAKIAVSNKDYNQAIVHLKHAIKLSRDSELKTIATVRLARVYLANNEPENAKKVMKSVSNVSSPTVEEVRGDIANALGDTEAAIAAYKKAETDYKNRQASEIVRMKLNDIQSS